MVGGRDSHAPRNRGGWWRRGKETETPRERAVYNIEQQPTINSRALVSNSAFVGGISEGKCNLGRHASAQTGHSAVVPQVGLCGLLRKYRFMSGSRGGAKCCTLTGTGEARASSPRPLHDVPIARLPAALLPYTAQSTTVTFESHPNCTRRYL